MLQLPSMSEVFFVAIRTIRNMGTYRIRFIIKKLYSFEHMEIRCALCCSEDRIDRKSKVLSLVAKD